MSLRTLTAIIITITVLTGCLSTHSERVADIDPRGWKPGDTVWIGYQNRDTVSLKDISLIVRSRLDFRADSIAVTVTLRAPDSLRASEPLTILINDRLTRHNDHYESMAPYRRSNLFTREGEYLFGFSVLEPYEGITAIGIKIE